MLKWTPFNVKAIEIYTLHTTLNCPCCRKITILNMVDKFNEAFNKSTIFLRISFFPATVTLVIFLIGFLIPSWKYLELNLDLRKLTAGNAESDIASRDFNVSSLLFYDELEMGFDFSYLDTNDTNLSKNINESIISHPFFVAYIKIGLWKTRVCTKMFAEEQCLHPFETQGYSWIRRSRGFCILALGMALLTVVLILMCLFLSIAADMLLTHVMTLLISIISVSSIVVGVLIFTTNHMKLDEETMVSNNMGMFQMSDSSLSWACWLSASATPSAAITVLFLSLNIVFY